MSARLLLTRCLLLLLLVDTWVPRRTQADGTKYEGEWLDNQRHGRGTQWVRRDGKLRKQYTGDWVMGKREVGAVSRPWHCICSDFS